MKWRYIGAYTFFHVLCLICVEYLCPFFEGQKKVHCGVLWRYSLYTLRHQGKKLKFQNTAGVLQRSEAFFHCQDLLVAGGFLHVNHHLADAGCLWDLWGSFGQNLIIVWSALSAHFHHFLGSVVLSLIRRRNCSQEFTERIPSENIWKPGGIAKLSKCRKQGTTCRNPLAARLIINAVG